MDRTTRKDQRGVTLIELLIALVISTILTAGIYRAFIGQQQSHAVQENVSDMQQNARIAVNRMLREIRMAGYGGKNASPFGKNDIIETFVVTNGGDVNGYTNIITPENNVVEDGITCDRITVVGAYHQLGTLNGAASAGDTQITVSYNSGVQFDTAKKKYVCINGAFNYEVVPGVGSVIGLKAGTSLNEDHKDGEPVFLVEAITFGLKMDNDGVTQVLYRNSNTGGGRQPLAENIESLRFLYRVWKKSDKSDGGEVAVPDLVNYAIVGVRANLVARTRLSDPQIAKTGDGYRRRTVETYIDVRNMKD